MQNAVALCYHIISSEKLLLQGMQAFLYGEKTLKNLCKFPIAAISYETRDMMEADRVMDEKTYWKIEKGELQQVKTAPQTY